MPDSDAVRISRLPNPKIRPTFAVQYGYVAFFIGLAALVWRAGVRRFEAFGG